MMASSGSLGQSEPFCMSLVAMISHSHTISQNHIFLLIGSVGQPEPPFSARLHGMLMHPTTEQVETGTGGILGFHQGHWPARAIP